MSQALSPVVAALNEAGVPAGLRALLIDSAQQAADAGAALESMRLLMGDALGALPKVRIERGVHAVCGSSGAGKTLMVTRLAFDAAQRLGAQRVALVVFDDTRPGAWSQMQVLAAQAGVSCFRAPDADTLRLLLNELGSRDLVLVDTAGGDAWAQAQRLQATGLELQVHALVPADASIASVRRVLADGSRWSSVMVSKLDECESSWPLMQALCDRQLPVSCTAASAQPQDAARPFDAQRLVKPAFKRLQADMAPAVIAMAPDAEAVHVPAKAPLKVSAKMPAKAKVGPEAPAVVTVKASARRAAAPALVKPAARGAASRAAA